MNQSYIVQLSWALAHLYESNGISINRMRLSDAEQNLLPTDKPIADLRLFLDRINENAAPAKLDDPDPAHLPAIAYDKELGWGAVMGRTPDGRLIFRQKGGEQNLAVDRLIENLYKVTPTSQKADQTSFQQLVRQNLLKYKGVMIEAVLASFFINVLALAVSLFSMQVYDRVIPTRSEYTLIILASGVVMVILFEMGMKFARSKIMDQVVVGIDNRLSRSVFERLLNVRVDQLPGSVGTMAAQLRGYEQIRNFYTATTLFTLVDLPFGVLFLVIISIIGSPLVAAVPLIAAVFALAIGLYTRRTIDLLAAEGAEASYRKTGILVEAVEGVETIKAGSGSWRFLSRWLDVLGITVENDLKMRRSTDYLSYVSQSLQQGSYVGIVIVGAYVVMSGGMTMGGLIACSILGGRVLAPVMQIPNLLVQHAHSRAALKNIESLYALQQDNHGIDRPLAPSNLKGDFALSGVAFNYGENQNPALQIQDLKIQAGERVGVLGPIGSGKSTLLRLMSGLYAPTQGRVMIDGLDMAQISRETLSQKVGYLQQDHRLFQGTLRENLLIGMPDPGDDVIQHAINRSGLINLVSGHTSGLDLPISEGGKGLSGGQKQLVAFTRILLTEPQVMLLDEPTASMDDRQERQCIAVLKQELSLGKTLVVSTHKMPLVELVDRLIVVVGNKIVMDGPKDKVLERLKGLDAAAQTQVEQKKAPSPSAVKYSAGQVSAQINPSRDS